MVRERVVVAMSGGVDSSVAAALLVARGYDVVGLMLQLWPESKTGSSPADTTCCALDAQRDADQVAESLGIPFYLIDMSSEFEHKVVNYFAAEYTAGRTPNPCVECNRQIRFDLLLRRALALDAQYLATGHYARVGQANDRYQLWRGVDPQKDQSYFLHVLSQAQLAHVLFPVGGYTKTQVREMARERGLLVAERSDSQDLCFVSDGDYRRFLAEHVPEVARPGPIRDSAGQVLSQHRGLAYYTIGQRKGLGISAPQPLYVLSIDASDNALIVGTASELGRDTCLARRVNWIAGEPPDTVFTATAKIRYRARDTSVRVTVGDNGDVRVQFAKPLRDITPGQAIVFYQDEIVLGGGTIAWQDTPGKRGGVR